MKLAILLLIAAAFTLQAQEILHTSLPRVIHRGDPPEYTDEALEAKLEGTVLLKTVVGIDGVPNEIKVVRGLGKGLDEKAIECLRQWRFAPATNHGDLIPMEITFEMNFRLPPSSKSK